MFLAILEGCLQVVQLLLQIFDFLLDVLGLLRYPCPYVARWACNEPVFRIRLWRNRYTSRGLHLPYALVNIGILR